MSRQEVLNPKSWAEQTFVCVQLRDSRRTRREVKAVIDLAENPLGFLPAQMHIWKETKAFYRLLNEPDVTFAVLMQPHLQQTRKQAQSTSLMPAVLVLSSVLPSRLPSIPVVHDPYEWNRGK